MNKVLAETLQRKTYSCGVSITSSGYDQSISFHVEARRPPTPEDAHDVIVYR